MSSIEERSVAAPTDRSIASRWIHGSPVYYGWIVLGMATLGMAATLPGQTAGVSLFIDALIRDLELSRSVISWLYTAATVVGASILPLVGRSLDRWGPRRVGVLVIAGLSVNCAGMGWVGGWIGVFAGFLGLRAFGQGALGLTNYHAVNLWFERRRGLAIGVLGGGMAGAMAIFPPLIERGIQALGWETTYLLIGAVLAVLVLPAGALLYREAPERYGLSPDGSSSATESNETEHSSESLPGLQPAVARRTRTFWLLTLAGLCTAGLGTGLLFHHFAILSESAVPRGLAAQFFIPFGIVTAAANFGTGWMTDHFSPRLLLSGQLTLFGVMMGLLPLVHTETGVWLYWLIFGLTQGMQKAILGTGYAHYFGRAHHGAIRGFASTIFIGGTAAGPPVLAWGPAFFDSFSTMLWILVPLPLVLAVVAGMSWLWNWDGDLILSRR